MKLQALALCALSTLQGSPQQKPAPASGVDRLLRAVPESALVVATSDDFDSIRAELEGNSWWKLSQSESMRGWMDSLFASIENDAGFVSNTDAGGEDAPAEVDEDAKKNVEEARQVMRQVGQFLDSVHGSVVGFVAIESDTIGLGGVLVEPGADAAAFETWVDGFLEIVGKDASSELAPYDGIDLKLYEGAPGSGDDHFAYFEHAGAAGFLISESRAQLVDGAHGVLDRLRGKDASNGVLGNARFVAAHGGSAVKGRIELYADVGGLIELGMREDPPDEEAAKIMRFLGVHELTWARARIDIGKGEQLDFEMAVEVPKTGGLARLLSHVRPCSDAFVRSIPRDAHSVGFVGLDIAGLWNEGWAIAAELNAEGAAEARQQIEGAGQMLGGADIEADLIEQLSGEMATYATVVSDEEWREVMAVTLGMLDEDARAALERLPKLGNAFVIGLRDGSAVAGVVEKLLEMSGMAAQIEIEEFQGDEISKLGIGPGASIAWAFQDRRVVISQFPSALRAVLAHKPDVDGVDKHPRWGPHLAANKQAAMLALAGTPESLKMMGSTFESISFMLPRNPVTSLFAHWPSAEEIDALFSGTMLTSVTSVPGLLSFRMATR